MPRLLSPGIDIDTRLQEARGAVVVPRVASEMKRGGPLRRSPRGIRSLESETVHRVQ